MTVGDSAEEYMLMHVLESERLPALSYNGLPSNPPKIPCFARWETIESWALFSTHQPSIVYLTESLVGARHTSSAIV